ncbi:MAG: LysR family transcriptional regulator [Cypionkella sp.]
MKPSIDLRQISYFLKTAELGNVTQAAKALNIAQPTLTKAIQLLEYQLKVALFERGPRGVTLSIFGERLLRHAQAVDLQVATAVTDIDLFRRGATGTVRIGAGPGWLRRRLPEVIADVITRRPELSVVVNGGFDQSLLQDLSRGDLDFVVAEMPLNRDNPEFKTEVLTEDDLIVVGRVGHPMHQPRQIAMAELVECAWALPPKTSLARQKFSAKLLSFGMAEPKRVTVSDSLAFILSLVAVSDVLTYTTRSALRTPEGRDLVGIDVPHLATSRQAGLIFRTPVLLSPAAEFVLHALREDCRQNPRN